MAREQEIERKFLVEEVPVWVRQLPGQTLRQGYLAAEPGRNEVRLRAYGEGVFMLTVKSSGGRVRDEKEIELLPEQFDRLWPLTLDARLEKTRIEVDLDDDRTAEIDLYHGRHEGLAVAEVEFPDKEAAEAFAPPPWFGREVTDDPSYKNRTLATAPHRRPAAACG